MKISKPIILCIPTKLKNDLHNYLNENKPKFKYEIIYFYYVIHFLTDRQLRNKNREFVAIDFKKLKDITISNIDKYVKILKKGEFINTDFYTSQVKAYWYKINEKYLSDVETIEIHPNSKLFENIVKYHRRQRTHYNRMPKHLQIMKKYFMNIDFDFDKAKKWIEKNADKKNKQIYLTSIQQIQDKRFRYFKRNKTNLRLDTNLTNLKSEFRQFIKGQFVSIDLKNSQPFFLFQLINSIINYQPNNNNNNKGTLCLKNKSLDILQMFGLKSFNDISKVRQNVEKSKNGEFINFGNSVKFGTLYDDFIKEFDGKITRKEVKQIMFKVLFSKNKIYNKYKLFVPYKKEKEIFKKVYPNIYKIVEILKDKDNAKLPIALQKIESFIFIDCIAKELVKSGIIPLTIHDSVIIKKECQAETIEVLNSVFMDKIGALPTFKVEAL